MKKEVKRPTTNTTYEWEFGREWFEDLQSKAAYNVYQSEYYARMAEEYDDDGYERKAERTLDCSKVWNLSWYVSHGVKQISNIVRCNDAFCYICQSLKAQRRFEIYSPILKELEKSNDIYHIVFTVPNVTGEALRWTLDKMYDRYGRLMEYFRGTKKIKGIDFGQYGYRGAVRSLEITTGKRKINDCNDFHPHFHCMFVLSKDAPNMEKVIENSFSTVKTDYKTGAKTVTTFSRFEWLLQRVWCLLMLDIKVTKENIANIYELTGGKYKDGFDVVANDAEGKYHEIFKYVIKGTYKKEKIFTYDEFCRLEAALRNRHVYQTYGCLREYNFNEVDDVFSPKTKLDVYFSLLLKELQTREKPLVVQSCLEEILQDFDKNKRRKKQIRYIGPATLKRAFSKMSEEEREVCFEKMLEAIFGNKEEVIGEGFVKPSNVSEICEA